MTLCGGDGLNVQRWDQALMTEVDPELKTDARWQLIERITASASFQKSARLRDLLRYMAERSLHGKLQDLSEHSIGSAVFGKARDYSVVEDSSVRVHVRQLRLKLHEYFDGEGRNETAIVEIPKGAYTTLFRPVEQRASATPVSEVARRGFKSWKSWRPLLPWALAGVFFRPPWRPGSSVQRGQRRHRRPGPLPSCLIRGTAPSRWW